MGYLNKQIPSLPKTTEFPYKNINAPVRMLCPKKGQLHQRNVSLGERLPGISSIKEMKLNLGLQ